MFIYYDYYKYKELNNETRKNLKMATYDGIIDPVAAWVDVQQLSTTALLKGGVGGPLNQQATELAARTKFLDDKIDALAASGIGAVGGGGDRAFLNTSNTINNSYTIPTGYNSGTFGPVSIASGINITIPSDSTWSII